jgi:hypothetical protein
VPGGEEVWFNLTLRGTACRPIPTASQGRFSTTPGRIGARGLSGISINEVVSRVDHYYARYPDQLQRPVMDAIFQAVVLPRLQAERTEGQRR